MSCRGFQSCGRWLPIYPNFDNFATAIVTLFIITTGSNWDILMHYGVDVVGVDVSMQQNHSQPNSFYYVVFVFISTFFLLSLVRAAATCVACATRLQTILCEAEQRHLLALWCRIDFVAIPSRLFVCKVRVGAFHVLRVLVAVHWCSLRELSAAEKVHGLVLVSDGSAARVGCFTASAVS